MRRFLREAHFIGSPPRRSDAFRQMHRVAAFLVAQKRAMTP